MHTVVYYTYLLFDNQLFCIYTKQNIVYRVSFDGRNLQFQSKLQKFPRQRLVRQRPFLHKTSD